MLTGRARRSGHDLPGPRERKVLFSFTKISSGPSRTKGTFFLYNSILQGSVCFSVHGCRMKFSDKHFDRILFLLLIVWEALLCYHFYRREIAWYPPGNFDQSKYLAMAYQIGNEAHQKGPLAIIIKALGSHFYTGVALPIEGALSGFVIGGARLPQLLVLFLEYCALQIFGFATARSLWGSRVYGYMMLGLILCQITPWYWSGGMFDFRLDFAAYCLYGLWVCAAMKSNLFLDRRWAVVTGLAGAFLVLHRFVTIVYLFGVSAAFAGICIALQIFWRTNGDITKRMRGRLLNLAISFGVVAVVTGPFFIRNWTAFYQYYATSHGESEVRVRYAQMQGVNSLVDHLLYYPKSILGDHLGFAFLLGSAMAIGASFVARFLFRSNVAVPKGAAPGDERFLLQIIFLLGTILGPLVVLTADVLKNPCVGSIVAVPVALLVVCLAAKVSPPPPGEPAAASSFRRFALGTSLAIFTLGLVTQYAYLGRHLPEYYQREDLARMVELDNWLVAYARSRGWQNPGISFDVNSPWLWASGITDTGFERSGEFVEFHPVLGDDVTAVERSEALAQLADSDFAVFTDSPKLGFTRTGLSVDASSDALRQFPKILLRFPFAEKLAEYSDDLKAWAAKNMTLVKTVQFENFTATVYARSAPISSDH
jgi:hypothetical protein